MHANHRVVDRPRTTWLHCLSKAVRPVTTPTSTLRLTISVLRLLVVRVVCVWVSLGTGVGVRSVGLVRGSGRPCGLRVVRLLPVRFLVIGVVYVVMVCNISVVGIDASTGDGGGRIRQVNLAACIVVVPIIVHVRHRRRYIGDNQVPGGWNMVDCTQA
jgi:hypothetical protein